MTRYLLCDGSSYFLNILRDEEGGGAFPGVSRASRLDKCRNTGNESSKSRELHFGIVPETCNKMIMSMFNLYSGAEPHQQATWCFLPTPGTISEKTYA